MEDPFSPKLNAVPQQVRDILVRLFYSKDRVRIWYRDTTCGRTAQPRMDKFEALGTVGRSMGPVRVPLLVFNSRALGGGPISEDSVIRIDRIRDRHTLYQHPEWKFPEWSIRSSDLPNVGAELYIDGALHSQHKDFPAARREVNFYLGHTYRK